MEALRFSHLVYIGLGELVLVRQKFGLISPHRPITLVTLVTFIALITLVTLITFVALITPIR